MPRKQKKRRIFLPPKINGYVPREGLSSYTISLNLDELEAIKLLDYENLHQEEVASMMKISRPTLTRIYDRARKKIASAIVEGKNMVIEGGNVYIEENWLLCSRCNITFNQIDESTNCPFCNSDQKITNLNDHINKNNIS